jgi:hypothetical protein
MNDDENIKFQSLWEASYGMFGRKYIVLNVYKKKSERCKINIYVTTLEDI